MARKRPTSLLVFGILHITFGTLSLLGALCGGIYLLSGVQEQMAQTQNANAALTKDPQEIELAEYQLRALGAQHKAPFYDANLAGTSVLNVVLCTLLIVGGIGLIKVAPWARAVSLTYAVLSILSSVWAAIYNVFILLPAMNAFLDAEVQNAGPLLSMTIRMLRAAGLDCAYLTPTVTASARFINSTRSTGGRRQSSHAARPSDRKPGATTSVCATRWMPGCPEPSPTTHTEGRRLSINS